jgi:predicted kinase
MRGPPGSGKSAIARELGRRLGWAVIDKDDVRDLLPDPVGGASYEAMLAIARRQLLLGMCAIADSPLGYGQSYHRALAIATETSALVGIVECVCSDEPEWRRRIEDRQSMDLASHHATSWERVHEFAARSASDPFEIGVPNLTVDTTSADLDATTGAILHWIRDIGTEDRAFVKHRVQLASTLCGSSRSDGRRLKTTRSTRPSLVNPALRAMPS